jgi:hypothetical protein
MLYGTQMYEVMRDWDNGHPGWDEIEHEFAAARHPKPKWVVSRSLQVVGARPRPALQRFSAARTVNCCQQTKALIDIR